ncbi:MAG: NADH-quinone reductase [Gammaproteobacteria bacterium]|nr:MAG: NADH-quinone reductase [Gammaproteobacteria bacterium]
MEPGVEAAMAEATVLNDHELLVEGTLPIGPEVIRLVRADDADILIDITGVKSGPEPGSFIVTAAETLSGQDHYLLNIAGSDAAWSIAPSAMAILVSVIISSALINNFVFTRYLGLCCFFGVSRKRDTAIGLGLTYVVVGVLSGVMAWVVQTFALGPLSLDFLQIIAFIGIVACFVQGADMIVKKLNRVLHQKFGIFLMLITTNCIILAVPLLNATNEAGFTEAFGLSLGSGLGFALALFLMSCARERVDMAPVPRVFQGLPVAFILCGLFAMSFLGFSGLSFF